MQVIVCNLAMFTMGQNLQVIDLDTQKVMSSHSVEGEDLVAAVCDMAYHCGISEVRVIGTPLYAEPYAKEIRTTYSLKYGYNNISWWKRNTFKENNRRYS